MSGGDDSLIISSLGKITGSSRDFPPLITEFWEVNNLAIFLVIRTSKVVSEFSEKSAELHLDRQSDPASDAINHKGLIAKVVSAQSLSPICCST